MSTSKRLLFSYKVDKQVESIEVVKSKDEAGNEVEVKKKIKITEPQNFRILLPHRKLREKAELYNAKTVSEYTTMGIMPLSLVAKRFGNDGGPLTEKEKEFVDRLQAKSLELQKEFYDLAGVEEKTGRRGELATEIIDIREKIAQIQNSYLGFFENTAEIKARKKLIDWWVVNIVERETKTKDFVPIVDGKTDDEKIDNFYALMDSEDSFIKETADKASYLISFWFASAADLDEKQFKTMEEVYDDQISNYEIEDERLAKQPIAPLQPDPTAEQIKPTESAPEPPTQTTP